MLQFILGIPQCWKRYEKTSSYIPKTCTRIFLRFNSIKVRKLLSFLDSHLLTSSMVGWKPSNSHPTWGPLPPQWGLARRGSGSPKEQGVEFMANPIQNLRENLRENHGRGWHILWKFRRIAGFLGGKPSCQLWGPCRSPGGWASLMAQLEASTMTWPVATQVFLWVAKLAYWQTYITMEYYHVSWENSRNVNVHHPSQTKFAVTRG